MELLPVTMKAAKRLRRKSMLKTIPESLQNQFIYIDNLPYPQQLNCEILNGEPIWIPVPNMKHQYILSKLSAVLFNELEDKGRGIVLGAPCNVMLSSWNIVRPDILFVRKNRTGIICKEIILGSPDIVVEILSVATRERDTKEKKRIYTDSCVPEYWIVDPGAETIEILTWSEMGYISTGISDKKYPLSSILLPDLKISVPGIFNGQPSFDF
jgi:Uma2 family endonuclease